MSDNGVIFVAATVGALAAAGALATAGSRSSGDEEKHYYYRLHFNGRGITPELYSFYPEEGPKGTFGRGPYCFSWLQTVPKSEAKRVQRELEQAGFKPLPPEEFGEQGSTARTETLGDLIEVGAKVLNPDLWLNAQGKPSRESITGALGIKIVRPDRLLPDYLYFVLEYLYGHGYWRQRRVTAQNVLAIGIRST